VKKSIYLLLFAYFVLVLGIFAWGVSDLYLVIGLMLSPPGALGLFYLFRSSPFTSSKKLEGWGAQRYAERIFENSSNLLFVVDQGGNILRRNKTSRDRLGREERDNLNIAEIVHPDYMDTVKEELANMFKMGQFRDVKVRLMAEEDEGKKVLPAQMRGVAVTDYAGVLEFTDQEEKYRLKRRLRESSARYRCLIEDAIDTLDSGVVLIDKNDQIVWVNETMEDFFEIDREHLIGLDANRALRSYVESFKEPESFLEMAESAYRDNSHVSNYTCYIEDGRGVEQRVLEYRSIPVETDRYQGGRIEHYIDISEVKRLERNLREKTKRLEKSNEKLEEFSRSISHDLKAPLQTIEGYSQVIEEDYQQKLDEEGKKRIQALGKTSQRLRQRIEGLLTYSSIEVEGGSFRPLDLGRIINEMRDDLDYVLEDVDFRLPEEFPAVYGHETLIIELLSNLITNAVKYNDKEDPMIEFGWERRGEDYLLWVEDNGQGIKEQYLKKIFEVFEKLNPRENPEGTGIGLALCKRIVEEHGGRIWAESELGEGTTFYFTLPGKEKELAISEKKDMDLESAKSKKKEPVSNR